MPRRNRIISEFVEILFTPGFSQVQIGCKFHWKPFQTVSLFCESHIAWLKLRCEQDANQA